MPVARRYPDPKKKEKKEAALIDRRPAQYVSTTDPHIRYGRNRWYVCIDPYPHSVPRGS